MISDRFGSSVAISGSRLLIGAPGDRTAGGNLDSGSAYLYDLNAPSAPTATLNNPTPAAYAHFGNALALSGSRAVIGAEWDSTNGTEAGAAYVYDFAGAAPSAPLVTLKNPGSAAFDFFGHAVAIYENRVVVSAYGHTTGSNSDGRACLYDLNSVQPELPTVVWADPNYGYHDNFGSSVAIFDARVVIGASPGSDGDSNSFSQFSFGGNIAYVYEVNGGSPTTPSFSIPDPNPGPDGFGSVTAISDYSIVMAVLNANQTGADDGAAYIFHGSSSPSITINAPSPAGENFGTTIAISGTRVLIGAPGDDLDGGNSGAAYLNVSGLSSFESTGILDLFLGPQPLRLANPSPALNDRFGSAVAIAGDYFLVSAPLDDTGASDAGSAYFYTISPVVPGSGVNFNHGTHQVTLTATLNNPNPHAGDQFGSAVAVWGHFAVVGAPGDDTMGTDAGAAYVYDLSGLTPSTPIATLRPPFPDAGARFGCSVSLSGSPSGSRVVVGASSVHGTFQDPGAVFVFDLASGTLLTTLSAPSPLAGAEFGCSVSLSGTLVVVGARHQDSAGSDSGAAYVYDLASPSPNLSALELQAPNPATGGDLFGNSVAISGSQVVVGAPQRNRGVAPFAPYQIAAGLAYVFDATGAAPGSSLSASATLSPQSLFQLSGNQNFGASVALDGSLAAIGEPLQRSSGPGRGAAYVFGSSANTPPSITLLGDNPLTLEASFSPYIDPGVVAVDAEDGVLSATLSSSQQGVDVSRPGTYSVIWETSDSGGLKNSVTRTLHVVDTTPPIFVLGTNVTLEATGPLTVVSSYPPPIGFILPFISISYSPPAGSGFPVGVTTVTGTATDGAGNHTDATFTVTVTDTTPPAITTPANLTVSATSAAGAVVTFPDPPASDLVGVTSLVCSPASGSVFPIGITSVTATAHDAAGNTASTFFTVAVTSDGPDHQKPVVAITSPTGRTVAAGFELAGTLRDDATLASFTVKLNGVPQPLQAPLVFSPNTSLSWSVAAVTPENGLNLIEVEAVDLAGHHMLVRKTVTFVNQRPALAGAYNVLLQPVGAPANNTAGLLSVTVSNTGAFTGRVTIGGQALGFSGLLDNDGQATFKPGFGAALTLPPGGVAPGSFGRLSFTVQDSDGLSASLIKATVPENLLASGTGQISTFGAHQLVPATLLNQPGPKPAKGTYNVVLPHHTPSASFPKGDGYFEVTLTNRGTITALGMLADGSKFTASSRLRADQSFPLFVPLYQGTGFAMTDLTFADLADSDLTGSDGLWFRPPNDDAPHYVGGWDHLGFSPFGTKYARPTSLDFGQGPVDLANGNALLILTPGAPLGQPVSIAPLTGAAKKVPPQAPDYSFKFAPATGVFSGTIRLSNGKMANYGGILLNKGVHRGGFGYLQGTTATDPNIDGSVTLAPNGP